MEKVAIMQALLADNCWEYFWINNNFLTVITHQCPHTSLLLCTIIPFLSENIWYMMEKIAILSTFICLGIMWICGHFSTPKIGLWTKINFFHVCVVVSVHTNQILNSLLVIFSNHTLLEVWSNILISAGFYLHLEKKWHLFQTL